MMLDKEKINRDLIIKDEMGKPFPAMDVLSFSISALVKDLLKSSSSTKSGGIFKDDVHWVLTVPAIWSDAAKQFMREAATMKPAKIKPEKLTIALEPEAASIYCRHLSIQNVKGKAVISEFPVGTKYLILDAGGGTIDITVHEVGLDGGLKEVHAATGGGWGGTLVDEAYKNLLIDLVGKNVHEKFVKTETEDWLELWRNFETKKKTIEPKSKGQITMTICQSLRDLCKSERRLELPELISFSKYSSAIEAKGDKLRIDSELMNDLFSHSIIMTVGHVKSILRHGGIRDIQAILMVGGYSDSPMLQEAMKREFGHLKIVIPKEASSAIMRGAVIFGHKQSTIKQRVLKKTYGMGTRRGFVLGLHDNRYMVENAWGDLRCEKLFSIFARKGEIVVAGKETKRKSFSPARPGLESMLLKFYASDLYDPEYTDQGCQMIGKLEVDISNVPGDEDRKIYVSFHFGDTELKAICRVEDSRQKLEAELDFLG